MTISIGVVVTIAVVLLGYLISGLLAWGKLTTKLDTIEKNQGQMVTNDSMRAALAEMQIKLMEKKDGK